MGPERFDLDPHLRLEHDLGGPITILAGYLQLIRDEELDLEVALVAMTRAVLDLTLVLADLADLSP